MGESALLCFRRDNEAGAQSGTSVAVHRFTKRDGRYLAPPSENSSLRILFWWMLALNDSVGPIPAGINAFEFTAPAPQHHLLPSVEPDEILGVTVIIITASYRDKEFVRVGYYVNTYYEEEEYKENPPAVVEWDKLYRNVLIEKPKVTR